MIFENEIWDFENSGGSASSALGGLHRLVLGGYRLVLLNSRFEFGTDERVGLKGCLKLIFNPCQALFSGTGTMAQSGVVDALERGITTHL